MITTQSNENNHSLTVVSGQRRLFAMIEQFGTAQVRDHVTGLMMTVRQVGDKLVVASDDHFESLEQLALQGDRRVCTA